MTRSLISPGDKQKNFDSSGKYLVISELFINALQGEGVYTGHLATFLRLTGCQVQCEWCDSWQIWNKGSRFNLDYLLSLLHKNKVVDKFKGGQHLVITGGSPVLQETAITDFLYHFYQRYGFFPFIEIENECSQVFKEEKELLPIVKCWNNSPKLANSGVIKEKRYCPEALIQQNNLENSWFKFVISQESDWDEIEEEYLKPGYISKDKVILMPEGCSWDTLTHEKKLMVAELAIEKGVRYSGRLQIDLYNTKTGV